MAFRTLRPSRLCLGLLLAGGVLVGDAYWLWLPRAVQLEGDVLIHLVFARNIAEGHWFEYGIGQTSRAGTSLAWEVLLAAVGRVTGLAHSQSGFLAVARAIAALCLVLLGWSLARLMRRLGVDHRWATLAAALCVVHPMVFYWTLANPMETGLVLLLVVGCFAAIDASPSTPAAAARMGMALGSLTVVMLLTRPELLLLGTTAAATVSLGSSHRRTFAISYGSTTLVGLAIVAALFSAAEVAVLPNAGAARRAYLAHFDARRMPWIGLRYSADPWLLAAVFAPLVVGSWQDVRSRDWAWRPQLVLAWLAAFACFFGFYYYTTWRGRYMLPVLVALVPFGVRALQRSGRLRQTMPHALLAWYVATCILTGVPLAKHADAPVRRSAKAVAPTYQPPAATRILAQEVQFVYFHPDLIAVSSDGLIGLEAFRAWKRDLSVREFILREKPVLIADSRFYLRDPEGLAERLRQALRARRSGAVGPLRLTYVGDAYGIGPLLRATYP